MKTKRSYNNVMIDNQSDSYSEGYVYWCNTRGEIRSRDITNPVKGIVKTNLSFGKEAGCCGHRCCSSDDNTVHRATLSSG